MVGKATIKSYDFKSIEEYFDYISDSKTNGNLLQAVRLYENLSNSQQTEFMTYMRELIGAEETMDLISFLKR